MEYCIKGQIIALKKINCPGIYITAIWWLTLELTASPAPTEVMHKNQVLAQVITQTLTTSDGITCAHFSRTRGRDGRCRTNLIWGLTRGSRWHAAAF